jgi:hypothetical protein
MTSLGGCVPPFSSMYYRGLWTKASTNLHALTNIPANIAPFSPDCATRHTTFPTRSTPLRTPYPAPLPPFCSSDASLHTPLGSSRRRRNYDGGLSLGWPNRKSGHRKADCDQAKH